MKNTRTKHNIRIPHPCHMTWKEMDKIENSTSRHCKECSVDLVDFTKMSDDEMIAYLATRKSEKTCVRMYAADALSDASKVQVVLLDWYKRIKSNRYLNRHIKAAILVVFGSVLLTACGCEEDVFPPDWEQASDSLSTKPVHSSDVIEYE